MAENIVIKKARVHNLKGIDVTLPRNKLVIITGLSGSGKSSLAFDTIYAEGQRRYVESLSTYARQFLGLMDKPDVESIEGLSPAIAIDQKSVSHNPRSTVGTVTEIHDYLRLLFARLGLPHCPKCGKLVQQQTIPQMIAAITAKPSGTAFTLLAPAITDKKGEHRNHVFRVRRAGFTRVRLDGQLMDIDEAEDTKLDKQKKHSLDVAVDRLEVAEDESFTRRLADSLETALEFGDGLATVLFANGTEQIFSQQYACANCHISLPPIEARTFSFNSPHGACPACTGLGTKLEVDPDLVIPNKRLSIAEGAIRPWSRSTANQTWYMRMLNAVAKTKGFSITVPVEKMAPEDLKAVLYGTGDTRYSVKYDSASFDGDYRSTFEGVIPNLERRFKETESDYIRGEIERYMRTSLCATCNGARLRPEALGVTIADHSIAQINSLSVAAAHEFFSALVKGSAFGTSQRQIGGPIIKEIIQRLAFLQNVGLDYLTLERSAATLSGGESQRIRLATQIGSALVGVLYVLDEPSIGLHPRDNTRLIRTLEALRDLGNTVIVVEHDEETIRAADHVIDIGPGAGEHGGRVVAEGTPAAIIKNKQSLTGQYLSGAKSIPVRSSYRDGNGKNLTVVGATAFNLKGVDVVIPLATLTCITGVSGSGKSTLVTEILSKALAQHFYQAKEAPAQHKEIKGLEHLDKVITIDQSPIGRTPRSNPATYTGLFTPIRDLFAALPEARLRGYDAGRFSFNVKGGRCEACQGDGLVRIEMNFLPDVYVECEECHGKRYNQQALEVHYRDKTIADVLAMTVEEAREFFKAIPVVANKLATLEEVGLGYIKLGQSATTLSGGEAQRVKLATELSRRATGRTMYILDEPTTGLHFEDVRKLLDVLQRLVDKGNTVLVVEHNLDVIKCADHVIDLGPEGGEGGGYVVATGTPAAVAKVKASYTGQYLKTFFEKHLTTAKAKKKG
jgi:excinuclease ABC subunit A